MSYCRPVFWFSCSLECHIFWTLEGLLNFGTGMHGRCVRLSQKHICSMEGCGSGLRLHHTSLIFVSSCNGMWSFKLYCLKVVIARPWGRAIAYCWSISFTCRRTQIKSLASPGTAENVCCLKSCRTTAGHCRQCWVRWTNGLTQYKTVSYISKMQE